MYVRILSSVIIIVAIVVGILALMLQPDQLIKLIVFRDFFDVALPILGFGALIKYLFTGIKCECSCNCNKK